MRTWVPPHTQEYRQLDDGTWLAQLAIGGELLGEPLTANTEPALRGLVCARLRQWAQEAGANDLGELLEQMGRSKGARVTLARRAAVEAALDEIEAG
jgi:hypothetical protein